MCLVLLAVLGTQIAALAAEEAGWMACASAESCCGTDVEHTADSCESRPCPHLLVMVMPVPPVLPSVHRSAVVQEERGMVWRDGPVFGIDLPPRTV